MLTDTVEQCLVGRRSAWVEAFPRGRVDRVEMKILVIVRSEYSENEYRRKG